MLPYEMTFLEHSVSHNLAHNEQATKSQISDMRGSTPTLTSTTHLKNSHRNLLAVIKPDLPLNPRGESTCAPRLTLLPAYYF